MATTATEFDRRQQRGSGNVYALAVIVGVAYLFYNVMPLYLKSVGDDRHLTEQQIGYLASIYLIGSVLSNALALLWVRRWNWRITVAVSGAIAGGGYLLSANAGYPALLALMFIVGAANAATVSCIYTFIGDSEQRERGFGYTVGVQNALAGVFSFLLPLLVIPQWGFAGVATATAACFLLTLPLIRQLPAAGSSANRAAMHATAATVPTTAPPPSRALLWAFVATFIYYVGQSGIWAFFGRIGGDGGLSDQALGLVFGVTLLTGSVGGFLSGWCARLGDRRWLLAIGILIGMLALLPLMFASGTGLLSFTLSVFLFCVSWNFLSPLFMTIMTEHDAEGRYTALIPACQLLGSVIGPALAGNMVQHGDYRSVYWFALASVLVCLAIFIAIENHGQRRIKAQTLETVNC